jgi:multicomponent Na+:H+ antiporter subunit G
MLSLLASGLGVALLLMGTLFCLLGAYGLLRMPDFYNRVHAASMIITFGAGGVLLAVLFLGPPEAGLRAVAIAAFLSLTAPMVTHILLRTAYGQELPLADETTRDDLARARPDRETR